MQRYESRDTRGVASYKRSKFDSNIDYDTRRHSESNDRDERKEFRRDSRERRFEDTRRERFTEKETGTASIIDSHRTSFPATSEARSSWSNPLTPGQWNSASERWISSFDTNSHTSSAISSSIIPNHSVNMEIYPNNFANIPMSGIPSSSSYIHQQNRRF